MNSSKIGLLIFSLCAMTALNAQNLRVKCDAYTVQGPSAGIDLSIALLSGEGVAHDLKNVSGHKVVLDPGSKYMLTYSKEGYVSKSILIETPEQLERSKTIEFDVMLTPQLDGDQIIQFDAEVGYIYFAEANNMKYEKDYSYSLVASSDTRVEIE